MFGKEDCGSMRKIVFQSISGSEYGTWEKSKREKNQKRKLIIALTATSTQRLLFQTSE